MLHEPLDIAHWKQVFSVARMRAEGQKPEDFNITGPRSIAVIEQLREETFASLPGIGRVPTDIFILNRGEPAQRAVTKISVPYRAAGKPWPIAPSGTPMTFVAQFCFADSRDLFPALPGDLLLVFIEGKEIRLRHRFPGWSSNIIYAFMWGHGDQRDSAVTFEWVSLGNFPLITPEEMPETSWNLMPFYGAIYRTWDYLNDDDGFAYPDVAPHIATTLEAMKIGGMYPSPWVPQEHLGTYLCTLNSVFLNHDGPYPFLNVPEPVSAEEWRNSSGHLLTIGDMGLMNIFLAADGSVRWAADG